MQIHSQLPSQAKVLSASCHVSDLLTQWLSYLGDQATLHFSWKPRLVSAISSGFVWNRSKQKRIWKNITSFHDLKPWAVWSHHFCPRKVVCKNPIESLRSFLGSCSPKDSVSILSHDDTCFLVDSLEQSAMRLLSLVGKCSFMFCPWVI